MVMMMMQNQNGSEELAACKSELEKAKEEIEKAWALYDKEKDCLEKINWQMTETSDRLQDVTQESSSSSIKSKSAQELETENRRAHSSWLSPSKTKDLMEKESPRAIPRPM
ncbi:uncharacterized protein LOC116613539 isoform X2 [Nematostella vectensis]|uniref:uncharacterized protein LOC116613539 isoform X2 n=1 Tax=Nematostella vectensis TaxID=45351 RepID=UPI0020770397|nr:uncharacterized protein LOC116613539 isoform X2 [Nematostella vectensis]